MTALFWLLVAIAVWAGIRALRHLRSQDRQP